MTKKKLAEKPPLTPIELHQDQALLIKDRYFAGIKAVIGTNDLQDRNIYMPHLYVGLRSIMVHSDGIEYFYHEAGKRHSLAVVEFQSNGGYKVIFHSISKTLVPKAIQAALPEIFNAAVLHPLFPEYSVYLSGGVMCIRTPSSWIPMRLDTINARHFALIKTLELVDVPGISPMLGAAPGRNDRWHTRFVEVTVEQPLVRTVSPLCEVTAISTAMASKEAHFDPDTEVADVPGEQL